MKSLDSETVLPDGQRRCNDMTLLMSPLKTDDQEEGGTTMSAGKIFLGVVMAMATGAVLGVLFAPDKGTITRKRLMKQQSRYMGTLKSTASGYADTLGEKFERVRGTASDLAGKVTDAVNALGSDEPKQQTRRT